MAPAAPAGAAIFTVTKTADTDDGVCDADCSLREAINAANAISEPNVIMFAIPGDGVISPTSQLPAIQGNTSINGDCASPIELDGAMAGASASGLVLAGFEAGVSGLAIHSFAHNGIELLPPGVFNLLNCNFIGTDATGTQALPNFNGVYVATSAQIGIGSGNLISGNTEAGIRVDSPATAVVIAGNQIGTDVSGTQPLGNGGPGIYFTSGTSLAYVGIRSFHLDPLPNRIAHNGAGAVWVYGDTTNLISIRFNSTFDNGGIGIDLVGTGAPVGTNPNDPGDPDEGPNRLQNFPTLVQAGIDTIRSRVVLLYFVDTDPANASYPLAVDFYREEAGGDEGEVYLGSASFGASDFAVGVPVIALLRPTTLPAPGDQIIATATDAAGNTSEFTPTSVTVDEASGLASALGVLGALALRKRWRP